MVLMAVADTNYRFVYVDSVSVRKILRFYHFWKIYAMDINSDKYAGITQWHTSFSNRLSHCTILYLQ